MLSNLNNIGWIGSLAAVHTKSLTITGNITLMDGELLEIEFTADPLFDLKTEVGCTIYSPDGIMAFETFVFAKMNCRLFLIVPEHIQKKLLHRRKEWRIPLTGTFGALTAYRMKKANKTVHCSEPVPLQILDISSTGAKIGFAENLPIEVDDWLDTYLDLGSPITARIEVKHIQQQSSGIHLGGAFVDLEAAARSGIRAFILEQQAKMRPLLISEEAKNREEQE
jgi:hypothetical protein